MHFHTCKTKLHTKSFNYSAVFPLWATNEWLFRTDAWPNCGEFNEHRVMCSVYGSRRYLMKHVKCRLTPRSLLNKWRVCGYEPQGCMAVAGLHGW